MRLTIMLVVGSLTVFSAPHRPRSPVVYDITSLVLSGSRAVTLLGGRKVSVPRGEFSRAHFVDEFPGANWEHPAKILFFEGPRKVAEIPVRLPPVGLTKKYKLGPPDESETPTFNISDLGGKYVVKNPSSFYALLINGHGDERHWNDFSFLYRVLTKVYGYLPQNIFVADGNFRQTAPDLDGNKTPDILHGSSVTDITGLLVLLAQRMQGRGDQLVLVVNDHGSTKDGESTLILSDGEMTASQFAELVRKIPAEKIFSIFEQCFSGGFVRPTVAPNRVSMAASTNLEISWASEDGLFDEFLYWVTSAFAHQRHDGTRVNADSDANGRVSAREAFVFGVANDKSWETPFTETYLNSGADFRVGFD